MRLIAVVELLPGVLDSQLRRDAELTHFEYFLLAMLSEAPERTLADDRARLADQRDPAPALPRRTPAGGPRPGRAVPCPEDGRATNARLTATGWDKVVDDRARPRRHRPRARDRRADPEADRPAGGDRRGHPRAHRPPRQAVAPDITPNITPDGEVREPMTSEEAPEETPWAHAGRGARGEEPRPGAHPGPARHGVGRGRGTRGVHRLRTPTPRSGHAPNGGAPAGSARSYDGRAVPGGTVSSPCPACSSTMPTASMWRSTCPAPSTGWTPRSPGFRSAVSSSSRRSPRRPGDERCPAVAEPARHALDRQGRGPGRPRGPAGPGSHFPTTPPRRGSPTARLSTSRWRTRPSGTTSCARCRWWSPTVGSPRSRPGPSRWWRVTPERPGFGQSSSSSSSTGRSAIRPRRRRHRSRRPAPSRAAASRRP